MKSVKYILISATLLMAVNISNAETAENDVSLGSIPGVTGASVNIVIQNGVATLSGNLDSGIEHAMLVDYVKHIEGVDQVIDLATH